MKRLFRVVPVVLAVVASAAVCSPPASIQAAEKAPVVGGYSAVSVKDREVIAATRFAVQTRRKAQKSKMVLVLIHSAEKQVVAGMNYRMYFTVKNDGKLQNIGAKVYKDLKGKYSLSSWEVGKRPQAGPNK